MAEAEVVLLVDEREMPMVAAEAGVIVVWARWMAVGRAKLMAVVKVLLRVAARAMVRVAPRAVAAEGMQPRLL